MKNDRNDILKKLRMELRLKEHILGVASGSGMTTKYSVKGGADLILALSAGRFRQAGRASFACYLAYTSSNDTVMDFATRELQTLLYDTPILFGLSASDPMIELEDYIGQIQNAGLAGIVNFPTVGLLDGNFRDALEADGLGYENEVEAIRIAHDKGLFTLAFVFNEEQTHQMIDAGADIICAHLGWTTGGALGPKKGKSIEAARAMADEIFSVCQKRNPNIIRMIYGGPIKSPADTQYFYDNTLCQGFIGGSSFERIPSEKAILNTTRSFKHPLDLQTAHELDDILEARTVDRDYVEYVQQHIAQNYQQPITLNEMAMTLHLSAPYLSALFKKKLGCSFTEYLIRFRMNQAAILLENDKLSITEIAEHVGYTDNAQFSKIFKKYKGVSPRAFRNLYNSRKVASK